MNQYWWIALPAIALAILLLPLVRKRSTTATADFTRGRECGHALVDRQVVLFGKSYTLEYPPKKGADYCADCIEKHAIRCAMCFGFIYPGHEINLLHVSEHLVLEGAVEYSKTPPIFIGCISKKCAEAAKDVTTSATWRIGPDYKGYAEIDPAFFSAQRALAQT